MTQQQAPSTPLPQVGASDETAHAEMSQRFQEHTLIEIEKGDRLQASEKIWASVAHALKAVAENRGWQNDSHYLLHAIAVQLGNESRRYGEYSDHYNSAAAIAMPRNMYEYNSAAAMHRNMYENQEDWDTIEYARQDAQTFIDKLNSLRSNNITPAPFLIRNESDQNRLAHLLGIRLPRRDAAGRKVILDQLLPINELSNEGFSPNYGYRLPGNPGGGD